MEINFLMCGRLGDFMQAMFAVKHICYDKNFKANIFMYDIGWEFGIENTHRELKEIFLTQNYVNKFEILRDYYLHPIQTPEKNSPIVIHNKEILNEGYIDLGSYIRSTYLYKVCWSELYSKTFEFNINEEYSWIKYPKINEELENKILIQRKANSLRNPKFPYKKIIEENKGNVLFISSLDRDYNEFPYKNEVEFYKIKTLDEWFTSINSCKLFIGNLSAPAAIANSLDKLRIIELQDFSINNFHTIGEEKYSNNISWYINDNLNNIK